MSENQCKCKEGFIEKLNNKNKVVSRRRTGIPHDCAYIAARNSLIEEAEKSANRIHNPLTEPAEWNRAFHAIMGMMAAARL